MRRAGKFSSPVNRTDKLCVGEDSLFFVLLQELLLRDDALLNEQLRECVGLRAARN